MGGRKVVESDKPDPCMVSSKAMEPSAVVAKAGDVEQLARLRVELVTLIKANSRLKFAWIWLSKENVNS